MGEIKIDKSEGSELRTIDTSESNRTEDAFRQHTPAPASVNCPSGPHIHSIKKFDSYSLLNRTDKNYGIYLTFVVI